MIDNKQKDSLFYGRGNNSSSVSSADIIKLIEEKKRNKDAHGVESYILCPKCGREIDYYWSKFAGVERARCRTAGCFNYNKALVPKEKPKLIKRKKPILIPRKKPKLILRRRKCIK